MCFSSQEEDFKYKRFGVLVKNTTKDKHVPITFRNLYQNKHWFVIDEQTHNIIQNLSAKLADVTNLTTQHLLASRIYS